MVIVMTRMKKASVILALSVFAGAVQADELFDELLVCRDLPSDEVRVFCYDSAVDRSRQRGGSPPPTTHASPPPVPAATAVPVATAAASGGAASEISQEDLFGKNGDEVQRTVEEVTGNERIENLNARITELRQAGYERVAMTLDNGQTWQQIDSSSLRLRVGDDVRIERASFGSFMLQKVGSKRTMRVKRLN